MKVFVLILAVVSSVPLGVFAQQSPLPTFSGVLPTNPLNNITAVENILLNVLGWMFTIFMILAVVMVIWAAFLYLTAAGNEQNVKKAKQQLVYAVIAIVIALMASGFEQVLLDLLQGE